MLFQLDTGMVYERNSDIVPRIGFFSKITRSLGIAHCNDFATHLETTTLRAMSGWLGDDTELIHELIRIE